MSLETVQNIDRNENIPTNARVFSALKVFVDNMKDSLGHYKFSLEEFCSTLVKKISSQHTFIAFVPNCGIEDIKLTYHKKLANNMKDLPFDLRLYKVKKCGVDVGSDNIHFRIIIGVDQEKNNIVLLDMYGKGEGDPFNEDTVWEATCEYARRRSSINEHFMAKDHTIRHKNFSNFSKEELFAYVLHEFSSLREQVDASTSLLKEAAVQIEEQEKEISLLQKERNQYKNRLQEMTSTVTALEKKNRTMEYKHEELMRSFEKKEDSIQRLVETNNSLKREKMKLKREVIMLDEKLAKEKTKEVKIFELEEENAQLRKMISKVETFFNKGLHMFDLDQQRTESKTHDRKKYQTKIFENDEYVGDDHVVHKTLKKYDSEHK